MVSQLRIHLLFLLKKYRVVFLAISIRKRWEGMMVSANTVIRYQLPKSVKDFNKNIEKLILKLLINDTTFCNGFGGRKEEPIR